MENIKSQLTEADYTIKEEKDISSGKQLRLTNGAIVNIFNTGTVNDQGKRADELRTILSLEVHEPSISYSAGSKAIHCEVFVVLGHDEEANTQFVQPIRGLSHLGATRFIYIGGLSFLIYNSPRLKGRQKDRLLEPITRRIKQFYNHLDDTRLPINHATVAPIYFG